jgi:transposase-like protein
MAHSTKSAPQRARLVARWQRSGSTQAAFARRHGLHPRTFWGWVREERAPVNAEPAFVPVQLAPPLASADAGRLEIALPTGECIRVGADCPAAWVAAVVAGLRPSC